MSITLCKDEAAWDLAVREMNGSLYQSWGWGELFRLAGRRPWRVLAEDCDGHRVAAQIFEINLMPGFRLMWAPFGFVATNHESRAMKEFTGWLCSFLIRKKSSVLANRPARHGHRRESEKSARKPRIQATSGPLARLGGVPKKCDGR
jgi:hypothetical protein